jgi:hypothetical protein
MTIELNSDYIDVISSVYAKELDAILTNVNEDRLLEYYK